MSSVFIRLKKAVIITSVFVITYLYFRAEIPISNFIIISPKALFSTGNQTLNILPPEAVRNLELSRVGPKPELESDLLDEAKFIERNLYSLKQDDPRLIKYVRYRYITPPSTKEYDFVFAEKNVFSTEISTWVRKFLKNKFTNLNSEQRNGIFIESGANDGELESHTLEFELDLGWTGLLVECNPTVVPYLRAKHRKAWVAGVCLSTDKKPSMVKFNNPVSFTHSGRFGDPVDLFAMTRVTTNWTTFDVETVPIYTILASIGFTEIDFWILDVEGTELAVLTHFPFEKIIVKLIVIEILFFNHSQLIEMDELLYSKGYKRVSNANLLKDWAYVHQSFIDYLETQN